MRVASIGSATVDLYVRADGATIMVWTTSVDSSRYMVLEYGGKMSVPFYEESVGGGGTNVAVGLRRLGFEVLFVGAVGDDAEAERVVATLTDEDVQLHHLQRVADVKTGYSVILGGMDGERSVLVYRGANTRLSPEKVDWDGVFECDALHLASLHGGAMRLLDVLSRRLERFNGRFFFNPGGPQIRAGLESLSPLLSRCDALIINRVEAERLTGRPATRRIIDHNRCMLCLACRDVCPQHIFVRVGGRMETQNEERCIRCGACINACHEGAILVEPWTHNLRDIFTDLKRYVSGVVVVTDGSAGVQSYDGRRFYALPAFPADVVDTLGAGDGFCAGFEAGLMLGGDVGDGLVWGAAVGALVTQKIGAKAGLPDRETLIQFITRHSDQQHKVRVFEDGVD